MNTVGILPIELTPLHWLLAYATAFIYVLLKVQSLNEEKGHKWGIYIKQHWASTVATAVMIPVCLIVLAKNFPDILPINEVTSCLVGWQQTPCLKH